MPATVFFFARRGSVRPLGHWIWRVTFWTFVSALVIAGAGLIGGRSLMLASLPRVSGTLVVPGLAGAVTISRDDRGVPAIRVPSGRETDAALALGFLHAQDRFFQMDLMRRRAAGELAELLGSFTLPSDREMRRYRFRSVAALALERLKEEHRALIDHYTRGVNAGLADLAVRPPEYLALAATPAEWRAEDSLLCVLAMHHGLSMGARFELQNDVFTALAPPGVAAFLMPETARSDHPLLGPPGDPLGPASIPGPEAVANWPEQKSPEAERDRALPLGSNNFAVAGALTDDGRAILASDMHLQLGVPNTWYHVQLEIGDRRVVGVSLPGAPGVIVGSNGHVAWAFTNVTGDFEDWVLIEPDPADPARYRTPGGETAPFGEIIEEIRVRGAPPETLTLRSTIWGPIIQRDALGRPLVLKWPALDADKINLNMLDVAGAITLESALAIMQSWWGPPQNALIASRDGRIAWTVTGWIPERAGFDGRLPTPWLIEGTGWRGPIAADRRPVIIDPPSERLATANARTLPPEQSRLLGWCWASGDRASRISELLDARDRFDERDLLAIQLDTRAAGFDLFQRLILDEIAERDEDPMISMARREAAAWTGKAEADSIGFRVIERFRNTLADRLLGPMWKQRRRVDPAFRYWCMQDDEPLTRILEERPQHFLPRGRTDWRAFLRESFRESLRLPGTNEDYSSAASWGDIHEANIQHAFAMAVPLLGRWLNMPRDPLPGHATTVRAQGRSFGASERLVVSPGHEDQAIFHMPCGQSGHPLSRHYADGQADWVRGAPRPLLSGPAISTFTLQPP